MNAEEAEIFLSEYRRVVVEVRDRPDNGLFAYIRVDWGLFLEEEEKFEKVDWTKEGF